MKTVLLQLYCKGEDSRPTDEHLRKWLIIEGLLQTDDRLRVIEVAKLPAGPPGPKELTEIRRGLELSEEDELEVLTVSARQEDEPPPEALSALLVAVLISEFGVTRLGQFGVLESDSLKAFKGCQNPDCPVCGQYGLITLLRGASQGCGDPNCPRCSPTVRHPKGDETS